MGKLYGLISSVCHREKWRLCSFVSEFVAKIQNPSVPDSRFKGFMIPPLHNFVGEYEEEILQRLLHAARYCIHRIQSFRLAFNITSCLLAMSRKRSPRT